MTKALKEAATLGRRATYSWRKWTGNGVLVFDDSMSGTRRIFAIGKKLGEGGYSTIWQVKCELTRILFCALDALRR